MKCTFLADWLACELLGRGNYPQKIKILPVNDDDHEYTKPFMTKHFFKKLAFITSVNC